MSEYNSSEELQRHNHDVFVAAELKKNQDSHLTEKQKVRKRLDFYINKHSSTVSVRAMAKDKSRDGNYQLDLSADLVEILEEIKSKFKG